MRESCANKAIVFLIAILGIALLLSLSTPLIHFGGRHTITVAASGTASGIPAEVQVSIYANGTGTSSSGAAANLSTTLNVLNSTLMNYVNGNESNISTDSYILTKVNVTHMPYLAVESLHAIVNVQRISALLGALSNISNVYVSGEYTMLSASQSSSLRSDALSSAIANATSQAHAVVGQNVVLTPINITVNTYRVYPIYGSTAAQSSSLVFYPGTAEVTGTVSVIFSYSK
jgi:uncharacterized protein YggE